jgi:hypothetical protein
MGRRPANPGGFGPNNASLTPIPKSTFVSRDPASFEVFRLVTGLVTEDGNIRGRKDGFCDKPLMVQFIGGLPYLQFIGHGLC